MKVFKVLYVLSATYMGGATISFLALLEGMKKRGVECVVTITDNNPEFIALLDKLDVKHYIVPVAFHSHSNINGFVSLLKYPYRMLKKFVRWHISINSIEEIARKEKVDFIHTNVGPIHAGYEAARRLGIHHVWHIREYGDKEFHIHEWPSTESFKRTLAKDYTIHITQDIRRHNKLEDNPKAYVVYNGVRKHDDVHFDKDKENYFLCASQMGRSKGHIDAIRVFSVFYKKHPTWKLRIIGRGGEKGYIEELKKLIKMGSVEDAVTLEGHKSNVTDYMRKAKALLVPSYNEGFGRMTAEASFAGTMVIGRNTGGTLEIMEKTGGIMFSNDDEFLAAMEKVASMSESEYKEKVLKSQRIAQELYAEESYVENVYKVYIGVLNDRKK